MAIAMRTISILALPIFAFAMTFLMLTQYLTFADVCAGTMTLTHVHAGMTAGNGDSGHHISIKSE